MFDEFAHKLAVEVGAPDCIGLVNLRGQQQFFSGLYTPPDTPREDAHKLGLINAASGRTMPLDYGYCPMVSTRRRALPLSDTRDFSGFTHTTVTVMLRVLTYLGAPLIDPDTDMVLGTVCLIDTRPHEWTAEHVAAIKDQAAQVIDYIHSPTRHRQA
ncbi:MAG TPA: GAF domain-containing protein [Pseudonocardiaceae bacterium]|nr:GAF domain-containing protein [Pseudonocardiaceae bacterium]